jgi:hypothetical protein
MQAINLEKEKKKGQGDRSAVWASNQPRRRPGGGGRPRRLGGSAQNGLARLLVCCWAGALGPWLRAGLGPAARVRGGGAGRGRLRLTAGWRTWPTPLSLLFGPRHTGRTQVALLLSSPLFFLSDGAQSRPVSRRRSGGAPVLFPLLLYFKQCMVRSRTWRRCSERFGAHCWCVSAGRRACRGVRARGARDRRGAHSGAHDAPDCARGWRGALAGAKGAQGGALGTSQAGSCRDLGAAGRAHGGRERYLGSRLAATPHGRDSLPGPGCVLRVRVRVQMCDGRERCRKATPWVRLRRPWRKRSAWWCTKTETWAYRGWRGWWLVSQWRADAVQMVRCAVP